MDETEIRTIADVKAIELGFDPEVSRPEVFRELHADDQLFLDDEGVDDRDGLVAVYYSPPSAFELGGFQLVNTGGHLTVYVHAPTGAVRAARVGE